MSSLWRVFIDDSADEKKQSHVVAGALIGRKHGWHQFATEWRKELRAAPRIEYFHQKEFAASDGQFLQFRDQEIWPRPTGKNAMTGKRERLQKLVVEASVVAIGVSVDIPAYERVRATHPRAKYFLNSDAFSLALQNVIFQAAKAIKRVHEEARIAFVSDDSTSATRYTDIYTGFKRRNPIIAKSMLGISHLDDKEWAGLQAADMIASTTKKVVDHHNQHNEIDTDLPLFEKFCMVGNVDEDYLLTILNDQSLSDKELENYHDLNATTDDKKKFDDEMDTLS